MDVVIVTVVQGDDDGHHPTYIAKLSLSGDSNNPSGTSESVAVCKRFGLYRELYEALPAEQPDIYTSVVKEPFPPSKSAVSSFFQLSESQRLERRSKLSAWLKGVCRRYTSLDPQPQKLLQQFFGLNPILAQF